jgi:hypothetical protein
MVLINGVDPVQRKIGGKTYTLEESGSWKACSARANYLREVGFSCRTIRKTDWGKVGGYKYLLYVSDKKREKR